MTANFARDDELNRITLERGAVQLLELRGWDVSWPESDSVVLMSVRKADDGSERAGVRLPRFAASLCDVGAALILREELD